jgi:hypothetical protein
MGFSRSIPQLQLHPIHRSQLARYPLLLRDYRAIIPVALSMLH